MELKYLQNMVTIHVNISHNFQHTYKQTTLVNVKFTLQNTRKQYRRQPGFASGKYFTGMTLKILLSVKNCLKLKM